MYISVCLVICFAVPGGCEINISAWEWEAEPHERIVARYFLRRQYMTTSILGGILFKNEVLNKPARKKRFLIYVHKSKDISSEINSSQLLNSSDHVLEGCSVSDCAYTQDASRLADADAVLVVLDGSGDTPPTRAAARHPRQRWVFAATGSPLHTIPSSMIAGLAGLFNWSMTYRSDADVPIPYGRTLALVAPPPVTSSSVSLPALVPHWRRKRRDVLAAALLSNCRARDRMRALNALQRYMRLHYYGNCFYRRPSQECPRFGECKSINRYLFYLAFENSECHQLLTERVYRHALMSGAIPVVMGASREECSALLPPGSYLHVDDYTTHKQLARHMQRIARSNELLLRFHAWRRHFVVSVEDAWAGARGRLCRLCEALQYNARQPRVYDEDDLRRFLDPHVNCRNTP